MKKFLMSVAVGLLMLFSPVDADAYKAKKTITLTIDNTILLTGVMDWVSTSKIMNKAQIMDAKLKSGEPIYLVLDTPGGSIQSGVEMITFLNGLNRPVHTLTIWAASMGFQTVQGLGKRYITHFGTIMAHKAWGVFRGEFPGQIDSRYIYYLRRLDEIDRLTVKRSKLKSVKELQRLYENGYWADGFDAVKKGLVDKVINAKCDFSLSGVRVDKYPRWGYTLVVEWSKCPLILGPVNIKAMVHSNQGAIELSEFLAKGGVFPQAKEEVKESSWYSSNDLEATTIGLSVKIINKALKEYRTPKYRHKVVTNPGAPIVTE